MLRSVSNQITGEAAVQRNKMAEEFKRQGYRADVAYDMANFQIIGHHQHLGGEAMKPKNKENLTRSVKQSSKS